MCEAAIVFLFPSRPETRTFVIDSIPGFSLFRNCYIPMDRAADALNDLLARKVTGKAVLLVDERI